MAEQKVSYKNTQKPKTIIKKTHKCKGISSQSAIPGQKEPKEHMYCVDSCHEPGN